MPKETFFNLREKKRKEIIDACFEEFALHDYQNASISRIVKKLGIAKGSIYQYFDNKRDLYHYLIEYSSRKRYEQIEELFEQEKDFFELIVKNFYMKVKFDIDYPVLSGFQYNLLKERNTEELGNIQKDIKVQIFKMIKEMIRKHQPDYNLRDDVDIDIMTFMVMQVQIGIYDFLEINRQVDFRENVKNKKPVFSISEEDIMNIIKGFTELLKNGIASTKG